MPEPCVVVEHRMTYRSRACGVTAAVASVLLGLPSDSVAQRPPLPKPRSTTDRTTAWGVCHAPVRPVRPAVSAAEALATAASTMGIDALGEQVRVSTVSDVTSLDYQSDRPYPPYLWTSREQRLTVAAQAGLVRMEFNAAGGGPAVVNDGTRAAVIMGARAQLVPVRSTNLTDERALDPWLVVRDWQRTTGASAAVRVEGACEYRGMPRLVLARGEGPGAERLFLALGSGYPVKLERREPHYLWGDQRVEYTWAIWTPVAGARALAPTYAFRVVDGDVNVQRRHANFRVAPADSANTLRMPQSVAPLEDRPLEVDTVRVAANTFLLRTPSYTNVVTLQRDTVYVLDAPVDAERARRDSVWIGRLFAGAHPVVVVVTDLAWPHIAGVRYWVAAGATILSRDANRGFLERVVQRRWALAPDVLERRRRATTFRFRAVRDSQTLAGGALRVLPIDGIGSEGALMVYLPGISFLWAGDFVQPGPPGSFSRVYANEVAAAVGRAGILPVKFAAMHFPLSDWSARPAH